ncbi:MAG: hypothetical protein KY442_12005 [Proteobacteria bacterium]|nr:hypothetical protein [Pseudomonadota bacterium]
MRDWLIVVVDARNARLLHGNADHLEELEQFQDHIEGQHERQNTSDHQRWVENQVDQHLKKAAAAVDRHLAGGRSDKVLVGAPPEIAPRFEEVMSNPAREKLAGRFDVEVPDAIPHDIRAAVLPCLEEDELRHEREVLAPALVVPALGELVAPHAPVLDGRVGALDAGGEHEVAGAAGRQAAAV